MTEDREWMQVLRGRLVELMVVLALGTALLSAVAYYGMELRRLRELEGLLQSLDGREVVVTDGREVVRGRLQAAADAICFTLVPSPEAAMLPGGNEAARCYAHAEVRSVLVEGSPPRVVVTVDDHPSSHGR